VSSLGPGLTVPVSAMLFLLLFACDLFRSWRYTVYFCLPSLRLAVALPLSSALACLEKDRARQTSHKRKV